MRFLGKFLKTLLRSIFSILVFLLIVGLAKMKWDVNGYVSFLNSNDWSVFHRSQPATWADPFRSSKEIDVTIDDMLSDEEIETEISGLDAYDPSMEEDLNAIPESEASVVEEEDFGFTTDENNSSGESSTIRDLINKNK